MMQRLTLFVVILTLTFAERALATSTPSTTYLWDQSWVETTSDSGITPYVAADDFVTGDQTRLEQVDLWLAELLGSQPGVFDTFNGSISWAIYANASGFPQAGPPLASGTDSSPEITYAGFDFMPGLDSFHVRVHIEPGVVLSAGTYWIAIHEGAWLSPDDHFGVGWILSHSTIGEVVSSSTTPTNPGSWVHIDNNDDAFALLGDLDFWNQPVYDPSVSTETDISGHVAAKKFAFTKGSQVYDAELWIADDMVNDNGRIDTLDGSISWALFDDDSGSPGTLLASGTDRSPHVQDTGVQDSADADIARVRIHLGAGVFISTGFHWLAIHEGAWSSASDGTNVWLLSAFSTVYGPCKVASPTSPVSWSTGPGDTAIVLFNDQIWSSGFDAGSTCAWSSRTGGLTCP